MDNVKDKSGNRLRGFTVLDPVPNDLLDMKRDWGANSVRLMMLPDHVCEEKGYDSYVQGWRDLVGQLPEYLDVAAELGIAVVLDLHTVPNDRRRLYNPDRKKALSDFWNDDSNLDCIISCWRELATMCVDRNQVVWYDILNEPLDWNDFPHIVSKWPRWAQIVINEIRKIDAESPIVVEVGPGGLCWGFAEFPLLEGENIIYSTHQYQPHEYTHQGIHDLNNTDLARAYANKQLGWPGEFSDTGGGWWNRDRLEEEMSAMIEFQRKHGVRIYISEFGVARWCPDAADYLRDSIELYEKYGWDWSLHAYRENPIWCLEHQEDFEQIIPATSLTERGKVALEYFRKNEFGV